MRRTVANRFVPANGTRQDLPAAGLVVYSYDSRKGPTFLAYKGRRSRADRHEAHATPELRDAALARYIEACTTERAELAERKQQPHGLAVGDVLTRTWGYEQTNVDFYQVVRLPSARSAVVREIKQTETSDGALSLSGTVMPGIGDFLPHAEEVLLRAAGPNCLGSRSGRLGWLQKWNGKPQRVSHYA